MKNSYSFKSNLEVAKEKKLTDDQIKSAYAEATKKSSVPIFKKNADGFYDIFFEDQWRKFEQEPEDLPVMPSRSPEPEGGFLDRDELMGVGSDVEEFDALMEDEDAMEVSSEYDFDNSYEEYDIIDNRIVH